MKKVMSVLLVMLLAASSLMLVACGGGNGSTSAPAADSAYIGTWEAARVEVKGEEAPITEVLQEGEVFIVELREDGSVTVTTETDTVEEGTWTETKKGVHVKAGETDVDLEADGDILYLSIFGVKLIFEKQ